MKIKNRNEVLNDVIRDGKKHPKGWKAIFGEDRTRFSRDYYLLNRDIGIYFLKEYNKNPFEVKGIGGKIARRVDDEIDAEISKKSGDFGIMQGDFQKILKNLEKGIKPDKIFNSAVKGKKDYGLKIPVKGKASSSKEAFKSIKNNLSDKHKKIDSKVEKMASDDGLYNSYG